MIDFLAQKNDGRKFYDTLKEVASKKPTIILKGGRTAYGASAAASHTGSIATNYTSLKAAINQSGATLCENLSDYVAAIKAFSFLPIPHGNRVGILTNSGGSAVLFSDNAEEFEMELAEFSEDFKQAITPHVIPLVKKVNPLDLIAGANGESYYQVTKAMLEDPNIDIVVPCAVIPTFLEMTLDEHYLGVIRAWNETGRKKPIIPIFMSGGPWIEPPAHAPWLVSLSPMIPARIRPRKNRRAGVAGSWKSTMPRRAAPAAPMPVHTA